MPEGMLLVVCPNLAIDRILQVDGLVPGAVQRSRPAVVQPGGKGSNVARVFRQLGGKTVLVGFTGSRNRRLVTGPLRSRGIVVDAIAAYEETRMCTIICDRSGASHPTVLNEESPEVEPGALKKLWTKVDRWLGLADAVLTTGSLSTGLPAELYAEILDRARRKGKITAIDATGAALRTGLAARPTFMKPNAAEMRELVASSTISLLAEHAAVTFGTAGAVVIHQGRCLYAPPPRISSVNPIGAGDAFVAGYLKSLLEQRSAMDCLRRALAASASDAASLRPGFIDAAAASSLMAKVDLRFTPSLD